MKRDFVARAVNRVCRQARDSVRFGRDLSFGAPLRRTAAALATVIGPIPRSLLLPHRESLAALAALTMDHRFDLLGSGWTKVAPGGEHLPVNRANRGRGTTLRQGISPSYKPIDWQCDFKSGYRWNQRTWHRHIRFGSVPGVDVKVPWELARMQHLPRLALAYGLDPDKRFPLEFRDQVLDFAAANPPRYGVNWYCAMDVAIRAVNWLVAYDLFRSFGAHFDPQFDTALSNLVLEHARYVRAHLERRGRHRNNHYLAGIAGLIFAARYLPHTTETEKWLRFGTGELIREVRHQFHPDGSNFEGSTSYHRLSGEMVLFATAALAGLPEPPELPAWYCQRIAGIADFTSSLQIADGQVPQIGDNDSGRFLHLTPRYRKLSWEDAYSRYVHLRRADTQPSGPVYWDLDDQDHSHLLEAADALVKASTPETLEGALLRAVAQGRHFAECPTATRLSASPASSLPPSITEGSPVILCQLDIGPTPVTHRAFPDFGLYLFRNADFFLSIRCGGRRGTHGHDDHLSIELHHRGSVLFRDPGTFAYTSHPALRRLYRSPAAHSVPYPVAEGANTPVFQSPGLSRSRCLYFGPHDFLGQGEYGKNRSAWRAISIQSETLEITDYLVGGPPAPPSDTMPYSPGYGKLSSEWLRGGRVQPQEVSQCVF